ncbi:MAG: hypothetical protein JWR08_856 [Enterovirga sp.]|jgi:alkylhydroperoxidase/carboxymuconolactone decarboxylase family protein YurZ|nr:hypothetical protein [Enterovirga sp.]
MDWNEYLKTIDPDLAGAYGTWLDRSSKHIDLSWRDRCIVLASVDAVLGVEPAYLDRDIAAAFDADVSLLELAEAFVVASYYEGVQAIQRGMEALQRVVAAREAAGRPVKRKGKEAVRGEATTKLGDRIWPHVFQRFDPELFRDYTAWLRRLEKHQELDYKTRELIIVGIDAAIYWPEPFIDMHVVMAFDYGATIQELLETCVVAGSVRGVHPVNHGLSAIYRTVRALEVDGQTPPYRRDNPEPPPEARWHVRF